VIVDIVAEVEALPEPDADICWLLKIAQLIAAVPEHQLVVAIGSYPPVTWDLMRATCGFG
jgi:hypothetical protein